MPSDDDSDAADLRAKLAASRQEIDSLLAERAELLRQTRELFDVIATLSSF
jgi:hypothetical protein